MPRIKQMQLDPGHYGFVGYKIPRSGWFEFSASSLEAFNSYILDEKGLNDFKSGKEDIESYGGFTNQREHHQEIKLQGNKVFYLVFYNKSKEPTVIFWEVY